MQKFFKTFLFSFVNLFTKKHVISNSDADIYFDLLACGGPGEVPCASAK